ncbi:hypothetical protein GCM10009817_37700 [Terrabacter lapilli]|uniref:GT2 family glycosyltransferase n=1 Tax=Terrabacter lapilli TaxID=436231 RepID=A0ABN2ST21_9MICO
MSVIVVGFGDEPLLEACLVSIVDQVEVGDEVVLIDHGITDVPSVAGVFVITPSANTGFGGGCVAGVDASRGDVLVFVNSDATLRPGAIAALTAAVADPAVGLAGGLVLLPGEPEVVNSAGLPVHLTGLSWCDGYGEPAAGPYLQSRRLASVAGALFACRRDTWQLLGGMDASYFMYHEDTDLSLRCHLAGLDVVLCPTAVAVHAYEFSRNSDKMFYLERNRFLTVLGDYPAHLLRRVLPVMLALEPLYLVVAIRDGWAHEKMRASWWVLRRPARVRARRRRVQAHVRERHALDALLTPGISQTQLPTPSGVPLLNLAIRAYWRILGPRSLRPGFAAPGHRPSVNVSVRLAAFAVSAAHPPREPTDNG